MRRAKNCLFGPASQAEESWGRRMRLLTAIARSSGYLPSATAHIKCTTTPTDAIEGSTNAKVMHSPTTNPARRRPMASASADSGSAVALRAQTRPHWPNNACEPKQLWHKRAGHMCNKRMRTHLQQVNSNWQPRVQRRLRISV